MLNVVNASGETLEAISCDSVLLNPTESNGDLRMKCRASSIIDLETNKVYSITPADQNDISDAGMWSNDSRFYYFTSTGPEPDDLMVKDVWTGETRNITNTPNRDESMLQVWKANPDWIIFDSFPVEGAGDGLAAGYLSAVRTDGTGYTIISRRTYSGSEGISPVGPTIVYTMLSDDYAHKGWLYQLGVGTQPFPVQGYGINRYDTIDYIGSWQWSPSGRYLTGWILGNREKDNRSEIFLLDWEAGTSTFIENLQRAYTGGYAPHNSIWSPDERWIVFYAGDEDEKGNFGLRIASRDGSQTRLVARMGQDYDGCNKVWSPDSSMLAFQCSSGLFDRGIWVVSVADWQVQRLALPENATLKGWAREP